MKMRRQPQPHKIPKSDRILRIIATETPSLNERPRERSVAVVVPSSTPSPKARTKQRVERSDSPTPTRYAFRKEACAVAPLEIRLGLSEADHIHRNFHRQDTEKEPPADSKELPHSHFPTAEGWSVPGEESLPPGRSSQSQEKFSQQVVFLNSDREENRSQRQGGSSLRPGLTKIMLARGGNK